jgi:hypothetical protein
LESAHCRPSAMEVRRSKLRSIRRTAVAS